MGSPARSGCVVTSRVEVPDTCPCVWGGACDRHGALALCASCAGSIGGAHGGPDAPWRVARGGEACRAADCVARDMAQHNRGAP